MTSWRDRVLVAGIVLTLGGACSQGAPSNPFPGFPPSPAGSQTSTSTGSATFGSGDGPGECCVANGSPGCNDEIVEACVCVESSDCCRGEWTADCAQLVDRLGCGVCGAPPEPEPDPDDSGEPPVGQDCCGAGTEPGCDDPVIEACVCAEIDFCCDTGWEEVCGAAVEALGCGECGEGSTGEPPPPPGGSTGDEPPPPPPPPMDDCCQPQESPGCSDVAVQGCVCAQDPFCCSDTWDQLCVDQIAEFMCGDCGGAMPPPGVSPCCEAQVGGGCGDPTIEACVCAIDQSCCDDVWDGVCAIFVELFLCEVCTS